MDGPQTSQGKAKNFGMTKRQQFHSGDIVYTKNGSIQTIPGLSKRMKTITEPVVGLQYIWEYRSPSKSVPPHYQCKLCKVQRLQNEMAAHITGWKHCFKYMKHCHPDKVPHDEEAATKDPSIRKAIKISASEVEKAKGRGQIKVAIKEPGELPAFRGMKTAQPSSKGPGTLGLLGPAPRAFNPGRLFGGDFPEPSFPGEFTPRGGLMSDFPLGDDMRAQPDVGRLTSPGRYGSSMPGPDRLMGGPESLNRFSNSGPMRMGTDGFGMDARNEGMGRPYSSDRIIGGRPKSPDSSHTLATLLQYLDSFRIENEDDAQIVLKVTQKLTDVLMEYRLRSISSVPCAASSSSLGNMNYSSRLPSNSGDRFSSSMSGPSRFYN